MHLMSDLCSTCSIYSSPCSSPCSFPRFIPLLVRFIPLLNIRHRDFWALDQVLRLCGINDLCFTKALVVPLAHFPRDVADDVICGVICIRVRRIRLVDAVGRSDGGSSGGRVLVRRIPRRLLISP